MDVAWGLVIGGGVAIGGIFRAGLAEGEKDADAGLANRQIKDERGGEGTD